MAELTLNPGESLLREEYVRIISGSVTVSSGMLYLTTHRLTFKRQPLGFDKIREFLAAGLFNKTKSYDFDIPLPLIRTITRKQVGFNNNIISIEIAEGKQYKLSLSFDEWLDAILRTLDTFHHCRFFESEEDKWTLQK